MLRPFCLPAGENSARSSCAIGGKRLLLFLPTQAARISNECRRREQQSTCSSAQRRRRRTFPSGGNARRLFQKSEWLRHARPSKGAAGGTRHFSSLRAHIQLAHSRRAFFFWFNPPLFPPLRRRIWIRFPTARPPCRRWISARRR